VTDANLVLGRLDPENFLGGRMLLDNSRAYHVVSVLGDQLNLDPVETALGVVEIANVHMERALRLISVERGYDPRDFTLLSFGGAGGLHAGDLARRLKIPVVLIPPMASTLSAFGMLAADVVKDYVLTVMLPDKTKPSRIASTFTPLIHQAIQEMADEGFALEQVSIERLVDVRYLGQSFELTIGFDPALRARFHKAHEKTYGYSHPGAPLEFVNIRIRAVGQVDSPVVTSLQPADPDPSPALMHAKAVAFREGKINTPFYRWELLKPGNRIQGPAVIIREDTTVLIHPVDEGFVDGFSNLIMKIGG
jgi:N-methylhydantoinase A